jgi:hypothetical protein
LLSLLFAAALLVRAMVPFGWMPGDDGLTEITLCSEGGRVAAWLDDNGVLHKQKPVGGEKQTPCTNAVANILDVPAQFAPTQPGLEPPHHAPMPIPVSGQIGQGLAAPPPPATGPPLPS